MKPNIAHATLLRHLHYDKLTGEFTWLVPTNTRIRVGERAGCSDKKGHTVVAILGKLYLAHRLAWFYVNGTWPVDQIDHRDTDKSNNRFDNLREATNALNQANTLLKVTNTSGYKGVRFIPQKKTLGKWAAAIKVNSRSRHLGMFDTAEAAAAAYAEAAKRMFGEFARC